MAYELAPFDISSLRVMNELKSGVQSYLQFIDKSLSNVMEMLFFLSQIISYIKHRIFI